MNILFITYYYDPDPVVGAKRVSYWAKHFKKVDNTAQVSVLTSTPKPNAEGVDNIFVVTPQSKPLLSYFIKDKGIAWGESLKSFVKNNKMGPFDFAIISGSPFMQFSLTPFLKKMFSCKVILDYRDPFAVNPRFNSGYLKIKIKKWFEGRFNKDADLVISVNRYCLYLLEGYKKEPEKYIVIPNGFDETLLPESGIRVDNKKELGLIYAGTFYSDRSPDVLLKTLDKIEDTELIHIGKASTLLLKADFVVELGLKSYSEMLKVISEQDAGVIITSGAAFESTTKIYDYMAMKKPIMVVTSGEIKSGALGEELANYPAVWAKNNEEDISRAINELNELKKASGEPDVSEYSRRGGLKKLIKQMKKM